MYAHFAEAGQARAGQELLVLRTAQAGSALAVTLAGIFSTFTELSTALQTITSN